PAAIKANAKYLMPAATIIYDADSFTERNLAKAKFQTNDPFAELNLEDYNKIAVPITSMTKEALIDFTMDNKDVLRSKNMFALGLVSWMFNRPLDVIEEALKAKFGKKQQIYDSNISVLHAGYNYGMNMQHQSPQFFVPVA